MPTNNHLFTPHMRQTSPTAASDNSMFFHMQLTCKSSSWQKNVFKKCIQKIQAKCNYQANGLGKNDHGFVVKWRHNVSRFQVYQNYYPWKIPTTVTSVHRQYSNLEQHTIHKIKEFP